MLYEDSSRLLQTSNTDAATGLPNTESESRNDVGSINLKKSFTAVYKGSHEGSHQGSLEGIEPKELPSVNVTI